MNHGIIMTIIIGFIVGVLARFIMPGKDAAGFIVTILLGIVGSFVGTWLGRVVGHYQADQSAGFLMSLVGALVVLGIYRVIVGRSSTV